MTIKKIIYLYRIKCTYFSINLLYNLLNFLGIMGCFFGKSDVFGTSVMLNTHDNTNF